MRTFLFPVLCLVPVTAALSAQSRTTTAVVTAPGTAGCPVSVSARYAQGGAVRNVDRTHANQHPDPHADPGLAYRLSFSSLHGAITQASIRFHGYSGDRLLPVSSDSGNASPSPAATEHFDLAFPTQTEKGLFQSVVYTHNLHGVDWIELDEVTFANGRHWHAPTPGTCRIVPDGFLLVGTR